METSKSLSHPNMVVIEIKNLCCHHIIATKRQLSMTIQPSRYHSSLPPITLLVQTLIDPLCPMTYVNYTYSTHTQATTTTHTQMLSHGDDDNNNNNSNLITTNHHNLASRSTTLISSSPSSSSSTTTTTSSNRSPFATARTMEEVWKDISLSATSHRGAAGKGYRGFILQDFLAKPFASNDMTATSGSSPGYGSPSPPPPPPKQPVMLNLNSGPDQLNFLTDDRSGSVCPFEQVLASANSSSGLLGGNIGGMRVLPPTDRTGGDRRHKRMIKNRESAARSRARKQAYTNELENEVERLKEENAMLRRQQEQLQVATTAPKTKKRGLQRTSTAPF